MGKVTVIHPETGERLDVDESSVGIMERMDYRRETPDESAQVSFDESVQREYSGADQALLAAGEGFVSGATFGLADQAMDDTSTRYRKELHPVASGVGELAGVVAPAILSGGSSLAGRAALATPAGLVARGAEAVAGKVVKGRLGHLAVSGAVEGLGQATGGLVSSALAGDEVTPEAVVNELGTGALLGLGAGVVGRGIEKTAGKLAKMGSKIDDVAGVADDVADDIVERSGSTWADSPDGYQYNKKIGGVQADARAALDKRFNEAAGELEKWSIGEPNKFHDSHFAGPEDLTGGGPAKKAAAGEAAAEAPGKPAKKGRQGSNRAGEINNDVVIDGYDPADVDRVYDVSDSQVVDEAVARPGPPRPPPGKRAAAEAEAVQSGRTLRGVDASPRQEPYVDVRLARPTKQFTRVPEPVVEPEIPEIPFDGRAPTKRIRAVSGDEVAEGAADAAAVADDIAETGGRADDVGSAGAGASAEGATGGGPVRRKKVAAVADAAVGPSPLGADEQYVGRAMDLAESRGELGISKLQRELKIGYNRAARIVDELEARGVIAAPNDKNVRAFLKRAELRPVADDVLKGADSAAVADDAVKAADDVGAAGAGTGAEAATGGGPVKKKRGVVSKDDIVDAAVQAGQDPKKLDDAAKDVLGQVDQTLTPGQEYVKLGKELMGLIQARTAMDALPKLSLESISKMSIDEIADVAQKLDVIHMRAPEMAKQLTNAMSEAFGSAAPKLKGWSALDVLGYHKVSDEVVGKLAGSNDAGKNVVALWATMRGLEDKVTKSAVAKAMKQGAEAGASKLGVEAPAAGGAGKKGFAGRMVNRAVGKAAGAMLGGSAMGGPLGYVLGWAVTDGLQSGAMSRTVQAAKRKALLGTAKALGALKGPGRPAAIAHMSTQDKLRTSVSPTEDTSDIKEEQALARHRIEQAIYLASSSGREALADSLSPLRAKSPELAAAFEADARRRAEYLAKFAPRKPQWAAMIGKDWVYPQDQVDRFAAVHRAVQQPMSVVEDFAAGTLTPDAAAAFRETSPGLYKLVSSYIVDHFDPSTASYNEGFSVSMLLGMPMHPSLMFVPTLQQDFTRPMGPQGGGGSAPPVGDPGAAAKHGTDAMQSTNS